MKPPSTERGRRVRGSGARRRAAGSTTRGAARAWWARSGWKIPACSSRGGASRRPAPRSSRSRKSIAPSALTSALRTRWLMSKSEPVPRGATERDDRAVGEGAPEIGRGPPPVRRPRPPRRASPTTCRPSARSAPSIRRTQRRLRVKRGSARAALEGDAHSSHAGVLYRGPTFRIAGEVDQALLSHVDLAQVHPRSDLTDLVADPVRHDGRMSE